MASSQVYQKNNRSMNAPDENVRRPDKRRHSHATTHLNIINAKHEHLSAEHAKYISSITRRWAKQCNRNHRRFDDLYAPQHRIFIHLHPHPPTWRPITVCTGRAMHTNREHPASTLTQLHKLQHYSYTSNMINHNIHAHTHTDTRQWQTPTQDARTNVGCTLSSTANSLGLRMPQTVGLHNT